MKVTPILALLAGLTLLAAPAGAEVFKPDSFRLANGLDVVVVSDHRASVVTHMVYYRVGGADEPQGFSGVAHFLEHLMFKGTATRAPGEFSRIVSRIGGQENAFTSYDYTGYYQTVAADQLETVMALEADRMANLALDANEVVAERQVVLEERRSRVENSPEARLREQINAVHYLSYPYRVPLIGWPEEIAALTRENALAFYKRWYGPNNAILLLAGDVTLERARALAEAHYGPVAAVDVPKRERLGEPEQIVARRLDFADPQIGQPSVSRRYLAPSILYGERQHAYPLEVLGEILGGGSTSRLYRRLVVEDKVAVSAGAWYEGERLGPGTFGFSASPASGQTLDAVEAAIDAEIARVLADGVTDAEVAGAIQRLRATAVYARDSMTAPARIIGGAMATGLTIEDIEAWPERIAAVTAARVAEAARAVFRLERSVTAFARPAPAR